ncbi:Type II/IV secretion system protein TadC, associated with Flp pilus assembly [Rhodovulum sp. P5]|uniref:type II secretion system F family protein n=1 Tax=Rhodovulum sp. P5 TaxID=1564506 RepID=UPI0009C32287|nr:type II secretion system F family protein [Rhodovulum sp. P5]ARE41382.1 Type II/IV secretion system protein TadC, associated with Flp pilus assembly [Rhodovulum sp. P5]
MQMLDTLTVLLTDRLGPLAPVYAIGVIGVAMIALTLPALLRRRPDPLDKLRQQTREMKAATVREPSTALRQSSQADKLDRFADFLEPQDDAEFSAVRMKLMQAGYRSKSSVRVYYFAQLTLGIGLLLVGLIFAVVKHSTTGASTTNMILTVLIPGAAGYYLPKYWVSRRVQERQESITNGFPDSLDMMLVCVEAGQSLDQSIIRVAKEMRAGFPHLADEYEIVAHEIKAGKDKVQVLKDMADRCGVTDVSSFVTVLVQSQTFGTSIAEALRVYAAEMRDKRVMRAEEKANKLPTKLTLGTMMFTVPPLLIALIGPSIHSIYETLSGSSF